MQILENLPNYQNQTLIHRFLLTFNGDLFQYCVLTLKIITIRIIIDHGLTLSSHLHSPIV